LSHAKSNNNPEKYQEKVLEVYEKIRKYFPINLSGIITLMLRKIEQKKIR
jgi:hypothetical protein